MILLVLSRCRGFFIKQKTADEVHISDWSSDWCSSALVDEIGRHSTGRKARREGAVEAVADTVEVGSVVKAAISALIAPEKSSEIVFPQGTIRFNAEGLAAIARTHGGGWDIDLIADAYRQQMEIGRAHV